MEPARQNQNYVPLVPQELINDEAKSAATKAVNEILKTWGGRIGITSIAALLSMLFFVFTYVPGKAEESAVTKVVERIQSNEIVIAAERKRIQSSLDAAGDIKLLAKAIDDRSNEVEELRMANESLSNERTQLAKDLVSERERLEKELTGERNKLTEELAELRRQLERLKQADEAKLAQWLEDIGKTENAESILNNQQAIKSALIPIGGVTAFWGDFDEASKLSNFELCDGTKVKTPDSPLFGKAKPQLIDRFPKGALARRKTMRDLVGAIGGNHNLIAHHHGVGSLAIAGGGAHGHDVWVRTGHSDVGPDHIVSRGEDNHVHESHVNGKANPIGNHDHGVSGRIGLAEGVDGDGGDNTGANQPSYQELFFLIRVK